MDADDSVLGLPALDDREALRNLLEAVKIAESAARQLAFYTGNRRWVLVSHNFGTIRQVCHQVAQETLAKRLRVA